MEQNVRNVHSYKKTPVIEVPEISQYFKPLLPSTLSSSLLSSPTSLQESPHTTLLSPSSSPFNCLFKKAAVETDDLTMWVIIDKWYHSFIVFWWVDAMIHLNSDELVCAVRLKSPDISIYAGNLIKCLTVWSFSFWSLGMEVNRGISRRSVHQW